MDKALREEFRAFKVEAEDRINRLEKAVKALSAPVPLKAAGVDEKPVLGAGGIQPHPNGGDGLIEGSGGAGGPSSGSLGGGGKASKKP